MNYGPGYLLFHAAGWAFSMLLPDRQISCLAVGAKGVGKDTLHDSISTNFQPVYKDRMPTTVENQGGKIRDKVRLENAPRMFRDYRNTQWLRRNYPHNAELIRNQYLEIRPELAFWILSGDDQDPHNWRHPYNSEVLRGLVAVIQSESRQRTKIRVDWRGKMVAHQKSSRRRCKYIIMAVNKMDTWKPEERSEMAKQIVDYYLQRNDGMRWLRTANDAPQLLYIATSFKDGNYLPFNQLHSDPKPLSGLFSHLVELLVVK